MNETMAFLSQSSQEYSSLNSKFLQNQKIQTKSIQDSLRVLGEDITSTFQRYQQNQEQEYSKQEKLISEQSDKIQQTLQGLLAEMLTSSKSSQQQSKGSMNSMITSLTQRSHETLQQCSQGLQTLGKEVETTSGEMQNIVITAVSTTEKSLQQNLKIANEVTIIVDGISDTAGDKRRRLDQTLEEVSTEIATSITSGMFFSLIHAS